MKYICSTWSRIFFRIDYTARFAEERTARYNGLVIGLTCLGLAGATILPFGELLNIIYPTVGYVGMLILACLVVTDAREYLSKTH